MDLEKGQTGGGDASPSGPGEAAGGEGAVVGPALNRALRALATGTTHVVALVEADGRIAWAGPSVAVQLGFRPDRMVDRHFSEFLHPDDLDSAINMMAAEVTRPGRSGEYGPDADIPGEYRFRHADGRWIPFEVMRNNFLDDPQVSAILIVARPVGARNELDQALSALVDDPDGIGALTRLTGYLDQRMAGTSSVVLIAGTPPEWIGGSPIQELVLHGRGPWDRALVTGEAVRVPVDEPGAFDPAARAAIATEGYVACWCMALPVRAPRVYTMGERGRAGGGVGEVTGCVVTLSRRELEPPAGYVGVLERVGGLADLAIRRRRERQRMRQIIDYDQVTGALSRAGLESMTTGSESLPRARLLIDLDDFKDVNDQYGHIMGDDVLRVAVKRIMSVLRFQDLLARLGGDEFLLLVADDDVEAPVAVARRITAVLEDPITVGSVSVQVRASIGIAPWDPEASPADLVERADQAMYTAKRGGKNRWAVWGV